MSINICFSFNQDHHGITQLGRIVPDGRVFGFIPASEDCTGRDMGCMQTLMDKVQVEWVKYAGPPSRLPLTRLRGWYWSLRFSGKRFHQMVHQLTRSK